MKRIKVLVQPSARVNCCCPTLVPNVYKLKTTAKAKNGQANRKIVEILSRYFHQPRSKIIITRGEKSKQKEITLLD